MTIRVVRLSLILLLSVMALTAGAAESLTTQNARVALVIGNSDYVNGKLRNPVNDARAIAGKLESLGFKVLLRENLNREAMYQSIDAFTKNLKAGGVGLFYYAGHGMQIKGRNYLIPVDANIQNEGDIEFRGIDANFVLSRMNEAHNRVNMLVLDACRNNPFGLNNRSANYGLAQMDAPKGTLIAFSTAPGALAKDGSGPNSIYTRNLVEKLSIPDIPVEEVFKDVRIAVAKETHDQQIPWESTSLMGDFYFVPLQAPNNDTAGKMPSPMETKTASQVMTVPQTVLRHPDKLNSSPSVKVVAVNKRKHKEKVRDYIHESQEIEIKAKSITSDELPALIEKAEQGDVIAQTTLSWAYYLGRGQSDGRGIPRKNTEVLKWLKAAAEQGYPVAENNLGAMYEDGVSVKQDFNKARHYYKLAADQGYLMGRVNLFHLNSQLTGRLDENELNELNRLMLKQVMGPVQ